ncbi:hypothetical protein [Vibrio phage vB_VhaS-a]|nr:hypothetical protein [Vibrio phage vB_VhaS-a]
MKPELKIIAPSELRLFSVYLLATKDTCEHKDAHTLTIGAYCLDEDDEQPLYMLLGDEEPQSPDDFHAVAKLFDFQEDQHITPEALKQLLDDSGL